MSSKQISFALLLLVIAINLSDNSKLGPKKRQHHHSVDREREAWADKHARDQAVFMTSGIDLDDFEDEQDYRYRPRYQESREYLPRRRPRRSYRRERRYPVDRKREAWADQHALGQAVYMTSGLGLYEGDDDYLGQEDSARPSRRKSDFKYRGRTSNRRRRQREPNFDDYLDNRPWMRSRRSNGINNYSNLQMILNNGTHNIKIKDRDHKLAKDVKIYEESLSDVLNSLPADELDIQPTNRRSGIIKRNKPGRATHISSQSRRSASIYGSGGRPSYSYRYSRPSYGYQDDYLSNYYGNRRRGINNYANNPGIKNKDSLKRNKPGQARSAELGCSHPNKVQNMRHYYESCKEDGIRYFLDYYSPVPYKKKQEIYQDCYAEVKDAFGCDLQNQEVQNYLGFSVNGNTALSGGASGGVKAQWGRKKKKTPRRPQRERESYEVVPNKQEYEEIIEDPWEVLSDETGEVSTGGDARVMPIIKPAIDDDEGDLMIDDNELVNQQARKSKIILGNMGRLDNVNRYPGRQEINQDESLYDIPDDKLKPVNYRQSRRRSRSYGYGGRPSHSRRYSRARPSYDYQDDYQDDYPDYEPGFDDYRRRSVYNYADNQGISSRAAQQRETRADNKAEIAARQAMRELP